MRNSHPVSQVPCPSPGSYSRIPSTAFSRKRFHVAKIAEERLRRPVCFVDVAHRFCRPPADGSESGAEAGPAKTLESNPTASPKSAKRGTQSADGFDGDRRGS